MLLYHTYHLGIPLGGILYGFVNLIENDAQCIARNLAYLLSISVCYNFGLQTTRGFIMKMFIVCMKWGSWNQTWILYTDCRTQAAYANELHPCTITSCCQSTFHFSCFRGLGLDQLMIKFLELYSDPKVLVLALNTKPAEEVCVCLCLSVWCNHVSGFVCVCHSVHACVMHMYVAVG